MQDEQDRLHDMQDRQKEEHDQLHDGMDRLQVEQNRTGCRRSRLGWGRGDQLQDEHNMLQVKQ